MLTHPEHAPIRFTGSTDTALVLLHGFTSGPASMRELAGLLAADGHHIRVPLLPGHGTSAWDLAGTPYQAWQRQVKQTIFELPETITSIWLVGQSMGGTLALDAACELDALPRFAGTFVINPALSIANPAAKAAGLLRYLVPVTAPISNDIKRAGQDELAYPLTPTGGVHQLNNLINATNRKLRCNAPFLKAVHAFRSTVDHVVPESSMDLLRQHLGAHLSTTVLHNSYHVASMDHDLELISSTILEKVNERKGGPA